MVGYWLHFISYPIWTLQQNLSLGLKFDKTRQNCMHFFALQRAPLTTLLVLFSTNVIYTGMKGRKAFNGSITNRYRFIVYSPLIKPWHYFYYYILRLPSSLTSSPSLTSSSHQHEVILYCIGDHSPLNRNTCAKFLSYRCKNMSRWSNIEQSSNKRLWIFSLCWRKGLHICIEWYRRELSHLP